MSGEVAAASGGGYQRELYMTLASRGPLGHCAAGRSFDPRADPCSSAEGVDGEVAVETDLGVITVHSDHAAFGASGTEYKSADVTLLAHFDVNWDGCSERTASTAPAPPEPLGVGYRQHTWRSAGTPEPRA